MELLFCIFVGTITKRTQGKSGNKSTLYIYIIFGSLSLLVLIFGAYEGTYGAETTSGRARCQADTKSFVKCFFMSEKELLDIYGIDLS